MEEALFRMTIILANFLQKLVCLKLISDSIRCLAMQTELLRIKHKVEAGQKQHYTFVNITVKHCIYNTKSNILVNDKSSKL